MKQTILLIGLLLLVVGCKSNIDNVEGTDCATHRFTTELPFCADLEDCMEDCDLVSGTFVSLRYRSSKLHLCYCVVNEEIKNIW